MAVGNSSSLVAGWHRFSRSSDLPDSQPVRGTGDVTRNVPTEITERLLTRYSELQEPQNTSIMRSHTTDHGPSHELRRPA